MNKKIIEEDLLKYNQKAKFTSASNGRLYYNAHLIGYSAIVVFCVPMEKMKDRTFRPEEIGYSLKEFISGWLTIHDKENERILNNSDKTVNYGY